MLASELKFGIPDLDLQWTCGGTVNPSCFAGHQLLVLFLPLDERQQAAELDSYERLSNQLSGTDSWLLVVATGPTEIDRERKVPVAIDSTGRAWAAFTKVANIKLDRPAGAAFLFTRGGAFHRVWPGPGRADEVVRELLSRG